ncbi:MAG: hypothetical protein JWQ42_302 [Edaphobacter sp.]|nr:hypothetical protein [Edaphobacter sp.]
MSDSQVLRSKILVFSLIFIVSTVTAKAEIGAPAAEPSKPTEITIVRKSGQEGGVAQMVEKGKVRKITSHAVQVWPVRGGQGALILVVEAKGSGPKKYLLRYYDLDTGRRRVLGDVPMKTGTVQELKGADEGWAFALSGNEMASGAPLTLVGDIDAITGVIPGATSPVFQGDSLTYTAMPGGEKQTVQAATLLGTGMHDIYSTPQSTPASPEYLQVFPDGTVMTFFANGTIHRGRWHTDGKTVEMAAEGERFSIPQTSLSVVKGVPARTRFSVRLIQPLSSRTAKEKMVVKAVSITPIVIDGNILIPSGSSYEGTVVQANSVGWGFKHETASLTIDWNRVTLADGRSLDISARVFQVENSQESVNAKGKIQGIRSTATPGHSAENGVLAFAGIDPIAYIFASASGSAVLGFAEPEILYNAGTELILEYARPVITAQAYPPSILPSADTTTEHEQLQDFVKAIPFRTRTKGSNKASDLTNLVFIGTPAALQRAFTAAGWVPSDELNAGSTFRTLKTLSGNQTYTQAPMSVLLLDERDPLFTLSKTTNTFSARHHIRVFPTDAKWNGQTTMTASSTQDIGIAFSRKHKTFIHVIDQHIDNERSKVINDLAFTRCVDSIDMIPRPWLPNDAYNSTGDRLLTDREVAVLHINSCDNPRTTPETVPPAPHRLERTTRNTSLTIRNGLYRGNLVYQGISGGFKVHDYLKKNSELQEDYGTWRMTDASGAKYRTFGSSPQLHRRISSPTLDAAPEDLAQIEQTKKSHKWDPPRYEFAIQGGYLRFRHNELSLVDVILQSSDPTLPFYELDLYDHVNDGWAFGGSVTVNSWRHFSNEFSYFRQQGKYLLETGTYQYRPTSDDESEEFDAQRVGIATRQFEYNLLIHPLPPTSRWRPYVAVGPVFQMIALADSPLKKPAGPFRLGLKNVGLIKAAFEFGNVAPLDGGGIFQFGLQYGAGIKYRVTPHMIVRADYRETWSKNPDMIKDSYVGYEPPEIDESYNTDVLRLAPPAKFFQDRFTLGVAFAF